MGRNMIYVEDLFLTGEVKLTSLNVETFAQYIFSRILRQTLDARKCGVSEKINHTSTKRINCYLRENLSTRKCLLGPGVRKFSSAKISKFTVSGACKLVTRKCLLVLTWVICKNLAVLIFLPG